MSARNYPKVIKLSLKHEGGYVDHPKDPGGATNYGITIGTLSSHLGRPATKAEVKNISMDTVHEIYRQSYWNAVRGDELPDGFDLVAFDGGVNSGPKRGKQWLQAGLGVTRDGKFGPETMGAALSSEDGVGVIQKACLARTNFLQGLRTWKTFGKGWGRRVAGIEAEAVYMYTRSIDVLISENKSVKKTKKAQTQAAGTTAAGGTGSTFTDIPDLAVYGIVALGLLVVVTLALKSRRNGFRTEAYQAKISEFEHE